MSAEMEFVELPVLGAERRTVPVAERITTVSVSITSFANLHAAQQRAVGDAGRREQAVAPHHVLASRISCVGSLMPILAARSRFSSVSRMSRPCIWPPMQRSAAAASTPSGAPPMPR